jgi:predicted membrane protein
MVSLDKAGPQNQRRVVLGVVIIVLGVLALFANALSGLHLLQFWPVMFIAFGCMKLSQAEQGRNSAVGVVFIVLGGLMILSNLGWFHFHDMWPLLLIGAGILLLVKNPRDLWNKLGYVHDRTDATAENQINLCAVFGSGDSKVITQDFQGGEVSAIFAGSNVDFSAASMQNRAVIRVFALFGGVELKVPADWSVLNNSVAVLGGVEDRSVAPKEASKSLVIEGFVMFGGIEIRN